MKRKLPYEKADDMRDVKSIYLKRITFQNMKRRVRLEEAEAGITPKRRVQNSIANLKKGR